MARGSRIVLLGAASVLLALPAEPAGAQDPDERRKDLMQGIRTALREGRTTLARGIEAILTDELRDPSTRLADQARELQRRLEDLRGEERRIEIALAELRWAERDADVLKGLSRIRMTPQTAVGLFRDSLSAHGDGDFDVSIPGFKKVYYAFRESDQPQLREYASISAYNIACGYSLDGRAEEALDWFELSILRGFFSFADQCHDSAVEHAHADTDLDNIRAHPRFKALIEKHAGR